MTRLDGDPSYLFGGKDENQLVATALQDVKTLEGIIAYALGEDPKQIEVAMGQPIITEDEITTPIEMLGDIDIPAIDILDMARNNNSEMRMANVLEQILQNYEGGEEVAEGVDVVLSDLGRYSLNFIYRLKQDVDFWSGDNYDLQAPVMQVVTSTVNHVLNNPDAAKAFYIYLHKVQSAYRWMFYPYPLNEFKHPFVRSYVEKYRKPMREIREKFDGYSEHWPVPVSSPAKWQK